ncbi:sufE-like protein 2, chloroplastic [Durio zibethinus]|uniref:SufE-like protein 2, chloroplastic n=1 Tax=Durio zibethinus TaxID=66656 RepID=A0A6P5XEG7_DURZI|nr:sufE-like protein 2, chloroplastic [Durio zibethinus]XP_022726736.1 sufE-like protein 2, chloroplastic [Durio zibethinus]
MICSSVRTSPYIPCYCFSDKHYCPNTKKIQIKFPRVNKSKFLCKSAGSDKIFAVSSCSTTIETPLDTTYRQGVSDKIQLLVSEFKSLTKPIDRVKRLLHYAEMLAPFDESARVPANQVKGCTTQVWLDARIDKNGKARFRADSDSEITKGYCSCLIWMMDGADPEEVVGVRAEDLVELNVGVHGKAQSRVNTWQNVLISMRDKTEALVVERKGKLPQLRPFPTFLVGSDHCSYTSV